MEIDYDFCKKTNMPVMDLLTWLNLDQYFDDYGYAHGIYNRNMMIIQESMVRVSETLDKFDRWANSEEMVFDTKKGSERRAFVEWVKEQNHGSTNG